MNARQPQSRALHTNASTQPRAQSLLSFYLYLRRVLGIKLQSFISIHLATRFQHALKFFVMPSQLEYRTEIQEVGVSSQQEHRNSFLMLGIKKCIITSSKLKGKGATRLAPSGVLCTGAILGAW